MAGQGFVTLRRVPTPTPDAQFYSSIARAEQVSGVGVPTMYWNSPTAIDHIPFYGPVFFWVKATSFDALGVTLMTSRLAGLVNTWLLLGAAAWLAHSLCRTPGRALWCVTLLLLAPEVNRQMGSGTMHPLAVAFELGAMAAFVRGLHGRPGGPVAHGLATGVLLALATLSTPRTYPFVAIFFGAAAVVPLFWQREGAEARAGVMTMTALAALTGLLLAWTAWSHGDVVAWVRYHAYILTREDTDVAVLPHATRYWAFNWTAVVTPLAAMAGAGLALRQLWRPDREARQHVLPVAFALLTVWLTFVAMVTLTSYTFAFSLYYAVPMLVVAVGLSRRWSGLSPRVVRTGIACLLVCDAALFGLHVARIAATWHARDVGPLNAFIASHVPTGSTVAGPIAPYFFPVERSGSHYRAVDPDSHADWARWVPAYAPDAVSPALHQHGTSDGLRFLFWPAADPVPPGYACAVRHVAGVFTPAPNHLHLLGPLGHPMDVGYETTILYRLPTDCPTGYDATRPPADASAGRDSRVVPADPRVRHQ